MIFAAFLQLFADVKQCKQTQMQNWRVYPGFLLMGHSFRNKTT
jgi:hypothetical protein